MIYRVLFVPVLVPTSLIKPSGLRSAVAFKTKMVARWSLA